MRKLILSLVFCIGSLTFIFSQQDAQYTQYMYNTLSVNPAYAGSRGVFSVAALHRAQWTGLDGAPTTQTLNIHTPISRSSGLGLSVVNDELGNGTSQETYFDGVYSYSVSTSEESRLSFGLKAGGHLLNVDFSRLRNYQNQGTTLASTNIDNKFSPNIGAGVYFHTNEFYAGLSVPNFLETEHFDSSGVSSASSSLAQERMNWYLISGYVFDLNRDWKFKPAILLKAVDGAPLQADLSATLLMRERVSFGAAYRWNAAFSGLFGLHVSDNFMIGLAYDKETTELGNISFNNGSFEVFLRYELSSRHRKILSPRFF